MKNSIDFSLYLVTHRGSLPFDDLLRIILQSIEGGVKIVQLREKEITSDEMIALGKKLLSFLRPRGIPLIINDRIDVAYEINADGVHLGQSDVNVDAARLILGEQAIIGLSVETIDQWIDAEKQDVDYLAASPVFFTKTKQNCSTPWGLDGLKHLCSISHHPIIAIGGIDETNVVQVTECGVAGVAVVSAIFNAPCPKTAAKAISNKLTRYAN
ncbi:MAG: thiamine phosphate synthase [Chlamydiales bacterium]